MASVALDRCGNERLAQQSLDHALGLDFGVRSLPAYHLTRARLLSAQANPEAALKQVKAETMPCKLGAILG